MPETKAWRRPWLLLDRKLDREWAGRIEHQQQPRERQRPCEGSRGLKPADLPI